MFAVKKLFTGTAHQMEWAAIVINYTFWVATTTASYHYHSTSALFAANCVESVVFLDLSFFV